ncbi:MAG: group II truncated hemoglobin [Betaproteobacteria bacterium]|nr:group II truncated hemoglobin [Betaproteobacteria bacterium]
MSPGEAAPEQTPYDLLGGETRVRALVDRFYALMDSEPAYADIRRLHPADLAGSTEKLFMFLSGWLGGPPLYFHAHGHPMLRARHLSFAIGARERDQWMACMQQAMNDCKVAPALQEALNDAFARTADHMRNRREHGTPGA